MNVELKTSMGARRLDGTGFEAPVKGDKAKLGPSEHMSLSRPALTVTSATVSPIADLDDVSALDLRRDDDLGQLISKAFDFQPPEMPNFV